MQLSRFRLTFHHGLAGTPPDRCPLQHDCIAIYESVILMMYSADSPYRIRGMVGPLRKEADFLQREDVAEVPAFLALTRAEFLRTLDRLRTYGQGELRTYRRLLERVTEPRLGRGYYLPWDSDEAFWLFCRTCGLSAPSVVRLYRCGLLDLPHQNGRAVLYIDPGYDGFLREARVAPRHSRQDISKVRRQECLTPDP